MARRDTEAFAFIRQFCVAQPLGLEDKDFERMETLKIVRLYRSHSSAT